ncbi:MAG: hypothetical protein AAFX01_02765 [Cyanobacteria bacterium J06638_28]
MKDLNQDSNETSLQSVTGRKATADEVAYRNGYVQGRSIEMQAHDRAAAYERRRAQKAADNSLTTGLLLGLLITGVAGIVGGIIYFYNPQSTTAPVAAPETTPETETTPAQVENNTTIIERTIERTREIVPAPSDISLPDVEINRPSGNTTEPTPTDESAPPDEAENTGESQPPAE